MKMNPVHLAESARATERAKRVLKPGDRLLIRRCGGAKVTVTLTGWDGEHWMTSATLSDIHAMHVLKVNGKPTTFADTIELPGGRIVRRFIRYPGPVDDDTPRCIRCGQIDEEPWHDAELCRQSLAIDDDSAPAH